MRIHPRHLLLLAVVVWGLGASSASAHFIWMLTVPKDDAVQIQVFFGESPEPDDPDLLSRIDKAEAWVLSGRRGEPSPVKLDRVDDILAAKADGASPLSVAILRHTYGVLSRGGGEPYLLQYFAKADPNTLPGNWRSVKDDERLPLELIPSIEGDEVFFRLMWKGTAVPNGDVVVNGDSLKEKIEGTTDEAGVFRCKLPEAGLFSIRGRYIDNVAGKHGDKEYKAIRNYTTLTLNYLPAKITPTIHNLPALPEGITSFGGASTGDAIYVYGGNYGSAHHYSMEDQSGDLWKLDLKSGKAWEKLPGGPKLQGLALVSHGGYLYRVGGFTALNKEGEDQQLKSQPDFARFNLAKQAWEELPPMPNGRSSHDAAIVGDTLYVVGGWNMDGVGRTADWQMPALAVDLTAKDLAWSEIAAPGFERRALALAAFDGKLFCIGGMQHEGGTTTRVAVYDPAAKAWSEGPSLLGNGMDGFGSSAFASGDALYVTTLSGSVQRLNAGAESWEYLGQMPHARFFHRLLPTDGNQLISVGGGNMRSGKVLEVDVLSVQK